MTEKLNVYQKLSKIRAEVPYLKKENEGNKYSYVGSSDVLGSLHGAINREGLVLVPRIIGHNVTEGQTKSGTVNYFTELDMTMTWVNIENPEDKVECSWYAQGMDLAGEKGVGKALTYGEKYFLLKFFNIATDKDDPDAFQRKTDSKKPPEPATKQQLAMLDTILVKIADITGTEKDVLQENIIQNTSINSSFEKLNKEEYGFALNYANKLKIAAEKKHKQQTEE